MQYPIFQSIVNKINETLIKRNINVSKFKTWEETKINAKGLEIIIDLSETTTHLRSLAINFDWDRFREAALAKQMNGTEKHPILKSETFVESKIHPFIDVELTWNFKVESCQPSQTSGDTNYRINIAKNWMESASEKVNHLLASDNIITRWHIEVDGDQKGKYLTAIHLISYYQYSMNELESLQDVHYFVSRKLTHLLYRSKKVIDVVDDTVQVTAA